MICKRFNSEIYVSRHANERMVERAISESLLLDLLETGDIRQKDPTRLWIAKYIAGRTDNLICAAVVLEYKLVVKTVMHHFCWGV